MGAKPRASSSLYRVELRPVAPPSWWPRAGQGWVTLRDDGRSWTTAPEGDPDIVMKRPEAVEAITDWLCEHSEEDEDSGEVAVEPERDARWQLRVWRCTRSGRLLGAPRQPRIRYVPALARVVELDP